MRSTLAAIRDHSRLQLQIVATGMHLSAAHGRTVNSIRNEGWTVDATVPWKTSRSPQQSAVATGTAMAGIAVAIAKLKSDIVLVVGDRVEAFAAASAAHLAGVVVAHVHGGDRALGQVDDSLRHAITKLAHLHFPATSQSEQRVLKLGEDRWRVYRAGSPGVDGIDADAAAFSRPASRRTSALLVLHPTGADDSVEQRRAQMLLAVVRETGFDTIQIIHPNNDPGSAGIARCWDKLGNPNTVHRSVPRNQFLAMMRDAAVLIGNSSSGIIEAASFGTPVIDVGPRQLGRETSSNVEHIDFDPARLTESLRRLWNDGKPVRHPRTNVYGGNGAGRKIATRLASVKLDERLRTKLIAY